MRRIIRIVLGIAINGRQRPTLIQATRAATAFTTGLALPGGYTYEFFVEEMKPFDQLSAFRRIYPDQLAALSGLTAIPIAAQPQAGVRYITAPAPHGLTATGQPTGAYTIGYETKEKTPMHLKWSISFLWWIYLVYYPWLMVLVHPRDISSMVHQQIWHQQLLNLGKWQWNVMNKKKCLLIFPWCLMCDWYVWMGILFYPCSDLLLRS